MSSKITWLTTALIGMIFLAACVDNSVGNETDMPVPPEIGDDWQTASLTEVGMDSSQISRLMAEIRDGEADHLHSLLLVKDGKLVVETYFQGYSMTQQHFVASVTKSVTSILIGIAIDQGYIAGPDQYLSDLLPAYADMINADPAKREMRLWHLLTMTSGLEWDETSYPYSDMRNDCRRLDTTSDGPKLVLARPVIDPPGTTFAYSCANTMLLSAVIESATGLRADQYARQVLFRPLGISSYVWEQYGDGLTQTDGGLHLRPRDMAKIGYLALNSGAWQGRQVVSPEWIAESTKGHVVANPIADYGYQWWRSQMPVYLQDVETFFAAGTGGQQILIAPEIDLVVVLTSAERNHDENVARNHAMLTNRILPAAMPLVWSKTVVWAWLLLTGVALIGLILSTGGRTMSSPAWHWRWAPIVALFGPWGWLVFYATQQRPSRATLALWHALIESMHSVAGNVLGLLLWIVVQTIYLPQSDAGPMIVLAPLLSGLLLFRVPLLASRNNCGYLRAIRNGWLPELISTCLTLTGLLPTLVLLTLRWFPFQIELSSPLFWLMLVPGAWAGLLFNYPFQLWLISSGADQQTGVTVGDGLDIAETDRSGLTWRQAWWVLLLSIFCLISAVAVTIARLA